jgi:hypothetical protein
MSRVGYYIIWFQRPQRTSIILGDSYAYYLCATRKLGLLGDHCLSPAPTSLLFRVTFSLGKLRVCKHLSWTYPRTRAHDMESRINSERHHQMQSFHGDVTQNPGDSCPIRMSLRDMNKFWPPQSRPPLIGIHDAGRSCGA